MSTESKDIEGTYFDDLPPIEQAAYHAAARRKKSLDALDAEQTFVELSRAIDLRELVIATIIVKEVDAATGKPLYSSEDKRKDELKRRRAIDAECTAAEEELDKARRRAAELMIEAEYHRDMKRVLCAFAEAGKER